MEKTYSTGDVIGKVPGLTRRKITYWIKKNYLDEVQTLWSGDNFQYRFTEANIKVLKKILENLDKGWSLWAAVEKAKKFFERPKKGNLPGTANFHGTSDHKTPLDRQAVPEG